VGVPEERIVRIGGRFTKEEMAELKQLMEQRDWVRRNRSASRPLPHASSKVRIDFTQWLA
jgi:hypothetical protein